MAWLMGQVQPKLTCTRKADQGGWCRAGSVRGAAGEVRCLGRSRRRRRQTIWRAVRTAETCKRCIRRRTAVAEAPSLDRRAAHGLKIVPASVARYINHHRHHRAYHTVCQPCYSVCLPSLPMPYLPLPPTASLYLPLPTNYVHALSYTQPQCVFIHRQPTIGYGSGGAQGQKGLTRGYRVEAAERAAAGW